LPDAGRSPLYEPDELHRRRRLFGYRLEDGRSLMEAMGVNGKEAVGSRGDDSPPAVLSGRARLLDDYVRQHFALVWNPPVAAIREELVTSLFTQLGSEKDLFQETPQHCRKLILKQPVLTDRDLARIPLSGIEELKVETLDITFEGDGEGLRRRLEELRSQAGEAVEAGRSVLVLSDRQAGPDRVPIPALLATSGIHHHLIRKGLRTRASIVVESAEPREVHHFCLLIGYGADAVN